MNINHFGQNQKNKKNLKKLVNTPNRLKDKL